ncbi:uncharacterized protein MONBRDRAFT_37199, partial [Monosiga brevicollis MX1]
MELWELTVLLVLNTFVMVFLQTQVLTGPPSASGIGSTLFGGASSNEAAQAQLKRLSGQVDELARAIEALRATSPSIDAVSQLLDAKLGQLAREPGPTTKNSAIPVAPAQPAAATAAAPAPSTAAPLALDATTMHFVFGLWDADEAMPDLFK